jgi:hypothetical protein
MAIGDTTDGGCIVTPIEAILSSLGIDYDGSTPSFLSFDDDDDDDDDDSDGGDNSNPGPSRRKRKRDQRRKYKRGKRPSTHHEPMEVSEQQQQQQRQRRQQQQRQQEQQKQQSSISFKCKDTSLEMSGEGLVFHQTDGVTQIFPATLFKHVPIRINPQSMPHNHRTYDFFRCVTTFFTIAWCAMFGNYPETYNAVKNIFRGSIEERKGKLDESQ